MYFTVVRTPSKLQSLLLARGVFETTVGSYLTIVAGDVRDQTAVEKALLSPEIRSAINNNSSLNSDSPPPRSVVDIIISSIGGKPQLTLLNPLKPVTLDNPTICTDGTRTILAALSALQHGGQNSLLTQKPLFLAISTTGISGTRRDVPLAFLPLYRWLLAAPHADKAEMESLLVDTVLHGHNSSIRGAVVVRPSLLLDGTAKGLKSTRVGWEYSRLDATELREPGNEHGKNGREEALGPAVGYTITREDVGAWIYEKIVNSAERDSWMGKSVTLTE